MERMISVEIMKCVLSVGWLQMGSVVSVRRPYIKPAVWDPETQNWADAPSSTLCRPRVCFLNNWTLYWKGTSDFFFLGSQRFQSERSIGGQTEWNWIVLRNYGTVTGEFSSPNNYVILSLSEMSEERWGLIFILFWLSRRIIFAVVVTELKVRAPR